MTNKNPFKRNEKNLTKRQNKPKICQIWSSTHRIPTSDVLHTITGEATLALKSA